jgi:serine/threonine-protein kinase
MSSAPAEPSSEFLALQRVVAGRYSLDRELGRGGMGIVFLARDVALERLVAIKLLPPALAGVPDLRQRFLREARTAAQLAHPNIVPIHAVEEHRELVFFVMAYVDGETLGQRARRAGPLPSAELIRVVQEVAWALDHAHARRVVHRDMKPDNVLLERETGRALVTDFGIAQPVEAGVDGSSGIVGTPHYMSPEQARGEAEPRSDLYSLGATAFFAASGRLPFEGSAAAVLAKHAREIPPPLSTVVPRLPRRLSQVIDRCLAKSPDDRPSAAALAEEIGRARGTLVEVPAPVRSFLREHAGAGTEIGMALVGSGAAIGLMVAFARDLFAPFVFVPIATVLSGLALARFGQVVLGMRDLRREGHGFGALRRALELERHRREEEEPIDPGARRRLVRSSWFYGLLGAVKTAFAVWLATVDGPVLINVIGAAGAVALPALFLRKIWTDLRRGRPGFWHRFLGSRVARWLFRAAGTGLRSRPELPAAGEPTAIALARAADQLFLALPDDARRRLEDVPGLIGRLEADAMALRAREGEGEGEGEGDGRARLATAVAALENLRLDLLRLHAGRATVDELTRDLARAEQVAREVDALLEREPGKPSPS